MKALSEMAFVTETQKPQSNKNQATLPFVVAALCHLQIQTIEIVKLIQWQSGQFQISTVFPFRKQFCNLTKIWF